MEKCFEIKIENGCFFKSLIDFLSTCVDKCWMDIDEDGIKITETCEKPKQNKFAFYIILERNHFNSFILNKPTKFQIDTKSLQKLCRNIKKKDRIIMTHTILENSEKQYLILTIIDDGMIGRNEEKIITLSSHYTKIDTTKRKVVETVGFCKVPFILPSSGVQNIKKSIGMKCTTVEILTQCPTFIQFKSTSYSIAPLIITYGTLNKDEKLFSINICGSIITVLSKLTQLSKDIQFFQYENNNHICMRIVSVIDIPKFIGKIELIINNIQEN